MNLAKNQPFYLAEIIPPFSRKNALKTALWSYFFFYLCNDFRRINEGDISPLFYYASMNVKEKITDLVNIKLEGTENFLVEVKVSPAKIIVSLDNAKGMKLDDCIVVNRFLQSELENSGVFEKHELEVGSPGMEEPLKVLKQFHKRIGQKVSVLSFDGLKKNGTLVNADENKLTLDEEISVKNGKKKEIQINRVEIPFDQIKETKVNFSFDKII